MRLRVDLKRAAQLYVDSSEAQHGDLELAWWDAEMWLRIFNEVLADEESEWGPDHPSYDEMGQ